MRAEPSAIGDVLFGKARGAILALLYGHPGEQFYYRQITRQLSHVSSGTLQRELDTLSQLGLVERSTVGKQVFYRANVRHPVYPELRALVSKTVGVFQILRSALALLEDRIATAFVYGSVARREEKAESDIDVMVIGQASVEEVIAQLTDAERLLGRAVNPTVYSALEFRRKLKAGNHFLCSVLGRERIFLIGDESELGKVAGIRMAEKRAYQP
ncbi:MAG TPA: nucleotidyltransferase domain-containing protein [Candidatus Angelobacter sp.]|nr:nucleotidyltransferase domain-containing protein [Candidatus Angelobacter sp.]